MIYLPIYLPSNRLLLLPNILLAYAKIQLSSKEIGSRPPVDYMQEYKKENPMFQQATHSHLIPIDLKSTGLTQTHVKVT
jgi:hypothetical protein